MRRGYKHISFVFWSAFWDKIVMGKKIFVLCLDVIMIAFFWFSIRNNYGLSLCISREKGNHYYNCTSKHSTEMIITSGAIMLFPWSALIDRGCRPIRVQNIALLL